MLRLLSFCGPGKMEKKEEAKGGVKRAAWKHKRARDVQVHFLGTSSATPTISRNVTCNVIRLENSRLWVVDCGEGTQMRFLKQGLPFERIDRIFITHLHGDHCYGIFGLLAMLAMKGSKRPTLLNKEEENEGEEEEEGEREEDDGGREMKKPVELYAPKGIKEMLDTVYKHSDAFIGFPLRITELEPETEYELGEMDGWLVSAYPLEHRVPCFGYVFKEKDARPSSGEGGSADQIFDASKAMAEGVPKGKLLGQLAAGKDVVLEDGRTVTRKDCMKDREPKPGRHLVLLGDTKNSERIVEAATGCDLLVHECTYDASMEGKALATGHSTSRMAGRFAQQVSAKRLVLTHFSSRYFQPWNDVKIATIEDLHEEARQECESSGTQVYVADDLWWIDIPPVG